MIKNIFLIFFKTLKKTLTFTGRSSQREYVIFTFFEFLIFTPYFLWFKYYADEPTILNIFILIAFYIKIFIYIFSTSSLTIRRLHDCGLKGWWYILNFIFSPCIFLILCLIKGDKEKNKYGIPPEE